MALHSANQIIELAEIDRLIVDSLEGSVETLTTATGAISLDTLVTICNTVTGTGATALTLADGRSGQLKLLIMTARNSTNNAVITPANWSNHTTLTFDAAKEFWLGIFLLGEWYTILTTGTAA